jgi:hypothetical protein
MLTSYFSEEIRILGLYSFLLTGTQMKIGLTVIIRVSKAPSCIMMLLLKQEIDMQNLGLVVRSKLQVDLSKNILKGRG